MSSRTRSRKQASIGSNHSLRRPTPISASEPRTGNFVLLLVMAWSPPAHNAGNVRVSAPGDYATFNSNHTPDGTDTADNQGYPSQISALKHATGRTGVHRPFCADSVLHGWRDAGDPFLISRKVLAALQEDGAINPEYPNRASSNHCDSPSAGLQRISGATDRAKSRCQLHAVEPAAMGRNRAPPRDRAAGTVFLRSTTWRKSSPSASASAYP